MAGMVVQHNMNALNSYNRLNTNIAGLKKSSEKLSSGFRINRAGDDAAGLAISEKMRSQIRGLNQAKRNSQDGISMIQTYEGALQETHSILQRMKELASESANGTYQNEVDRDAIQLEFSQLNDELNQIADTDFNGVVMLNGGQMADGTKAVDGKFDYENAVRDPKQLTSSDVSVTDDQLIDNPDNADTVWNDLNANWDRTDTPTANDGPESVDLMFKYDATGGEDGETFWSCTGATNGADYNNVTVENTTNGGFTVKTANGDIANVVVDQSKLINGDTLTLTVSNPNAGISAPSNGGATQISSTFEQGAKAAAVKETEADLTVTTAEIDKADYTETMNSIYKALDGATVTTEYKDSTATAAADMTITLSDDDGTKLVAGKNTVYVDGQKVELFAKFDAGKITIGTPNDAGDAVGTELMSFEMATKGTANSDSTGVITYKIGVENYDYNTSSLPSADVKNPVDGAVSKANSNNAATAPLTYTDHLVLQTGARTKDSVDFTFNYDTDGMGELKSNLDVSSRENGLNTANLSLATQEDANAAIDKIDNAINKVSMVRATFGATQNRLEHKIENLTATAENLTEAESTIRDTDMASEMMNYTKYNILQQAAQSMLAQANQQPQSILQLLG